MHVVIHTWIKGGHPVGKGQLKTLDGYLFCDGAKLEHPFLERRNGNIVQQGSELVPTDAVCFA